VGDQRHAPSALPPGKTRYPFIGGWVDPKAGLDGCGKSRSPPGFDSQNVQPVVSRYSGWAIPALSMILLLLHNILFMSIFSSFINWMRANEVFDRFEVPTALFMRIQLFSPSDPRRPRHFLPLTHREPLTQWHVISQKTWIPKGGIL